jgi:predicted oxidoreductase
MQTLLLETDHIVELSGLSNGLTGAAVADATVTVTLRDAQGQAVAGATWPAAALAVADVPGTYRSTLPATLHLAPRQWLEALVVADAGPGLKRTWRLPLQVAPLARWDIRRLGE